MVDTDRFLKDRLQTVLAQPSATLGAVRPVCGIGVTAMVMSVTVVCDLAQAQSNTRDTTHWEARSRERRQPW